MVTFPVDLSQKFVTMSQDPLIPRNFKFQTLKVMYARNSKIYPNKGPLKFTVQVQYQSVLEIESGV